MNCCFQRKMSLLTVFTYQAYEIYCKGRGIWDAKSMFSWEKKWCRKNVIVLKHNVADRKTTTQKHTCTKKAFQKRPRKSKKKKMSSWWIQCLKMWLFIGGKKKVEMDLDESQTAGQVTIYTKSLICITADKSPHGAFLVQCMHLTVLSVFIK